MIKPSIAPRELIDAQSESTIFKSSSLPVDPKIKEFLAMKMTGNAFNKYCIDCKKKRTTHFLI